MSIELVDYYIYSANNKLLKVLRISDLNDVNKVTKFCSYILQNSSAHIRVYADHKPISGQCAVKRVLMCCYLALLIHSSEQTINVVT